MEISNKRNYKLEYYYNHREELKEKMRNYYYDNRITLNDKHKKYYQLNKEQILNYHKLYLENNRNKIIEKRKKEYLNKYKNTSKYNYFKQYYNLIDYPLNKIIEIYNFKINFKNNPKYKFKVDFILTVKELMDIDI